MSNSEIIDKKTHIEGDNNFVDILAKGLGKMIENRDDDTDGKFPDFCEKLFVDSILPNPELISQMEKIVSEKFAGGTTSEFMSQMGKIVGNILNENTNFIDVNESDNVTESENCAINDITYINNDVESFFENEYHETRDFDIAKIITKEKFNLSSGHTISVQIDVVL